MGAHRIAIALCLVLAMVCVVAQRPKLKYGITLAECGVSASISLAQKQTVLWYANYTNANGGVNISGVIHDLEFVMYAFSAGLISVLTITISYNDAFDAELMSTHSARTAVSAYAMR